MLAWGISQFMSGLWAVQPTLKRLVDCNGTALSLNQTVKLVGTITSLSQTEGHFGCVVITATHPNGLYSPGANTTFNVDPANLVVGS